MKENVKEIWKLVGLLKRGNSVWQKASDQEQQIILNKCQWIFDRLVILGATSGFGEALLMYGSDFLEKEWGLPVPLIKTETMIEAQRIFNKRTRGLTFGDIEAQALAKEHGVCAYKTVGYEQLADKMYHPIIEVYGYFANRVIKNGEQIHVVLSEEIEKSEQQKVS